MNQPQLKMLKRILFYAFPILLALPQNALAVFNIEINPVGSLNGNTAALNSFNRTAAQRESHISDDITVNIDAGLSAALGPNIIGQTSTTLLINSYTFIRDAMVFDSFDEPDDWIVSYLPTASQFSALVPVVDSVPFTLSGDLLGSKANFKALGFTGLDVEFGTNDAIITFNKNFSFDYDNSDGIDPGTMDFETVAAHEIGHALGFISDIDVDIDYPLSNNQTGEINPFTLDMFRFENDPGEDPSNLEEFTNAPRYLLPGGDAIFDDLDKEWSMSTGANTGDGRQASHWKDNGLTNYLIGIMDPTLAYGDIVNISSADLRALDLIGYEINIVPLPGVFWLFSSGLLGLAFLRRKSES